MLKLGIQSKHTPIRLPPSANVAADGSQLQVLGWGYDGSMTISPILKQAPNIEIVNRDLCSSDDLWGSVIKDSMVCAFGFTGEDVCGGDEFVLTMLMLLILFERVIRFLLLHVLLLQVERICNVSIKTNILFVVS